MKIVDRNGTICEKEGIQNSNGMKGRAFGLAD